MPFREKLKLLEGSSVCGGGDRQGKGILFHRLEMSAKNDLQKTGEERGK